MQGIGWEQGNRRRKVSNKYVNKSSVSDGRAATHQQIVGCVFPSYTRLSPRHCRLPLLYDVIITLTRRPASHAVITDFWVPSGPSYRRPTGDVSRLCIGTRVNKSVVPFVSYIYLLGERSGSNLCDFKQECQPNKAS